MSIQRRWIEGKTVARVDVVSVPQDVGSSRPAYQSFERIVFTDGSTLTMVAIETETDVDVEAAYYPADKRRQR